MERLLILSSDGKKILERDVSAEKGPLLVVKDAEGLHLAASTSAGDAVMGALVRDEDGWTLASATAGADVVSGPKKAGSLPLLAGQQLLLGGFIFKIEGESAQSGRVLVWRLGRSPVAADAVLAGRNVVTYDAVTGLAAVNPAIQDNVLFEFYPDVQGVEVVSRTGEHLTVAENAAFEVGDFRAIVLPHADAAAAMKTRYPFAWPTRRMRRVLVLSIAAILGAFIVSGLVNQSAAMLESLSHSGSAVAQQTEATVHFSNDSLNDDRYLFLFTFYRDLPIILQAEESLVSHDLLKRLEDVPNASDLVPLKTLIESIICCQRGMATDRWQMIDDVIKNVPRRLFETYGADAFYDDVVELIGLIRESLPEIVLRETVYGGGDSENLYSRIVKTVQGLEDNRFITADTVYSLIAKIRINIELLRDYIKARDALLGVKGQPPLETPNAIADVTRTFAVLVSIIDNAPGMEGYVPLLDREKKLLRTRLETWTSRPGLLDAAIDLAAVVGVDEAQLETWRHQVIAQRRAVDEQVRRLYREYRLKVRNNPARARDILNEILKATDTDQKSPFRAWAEREVGKEKKEAQK